MHLFLVVLGGRSRGCHIEQHDVRFVAGDQLDDTLPELRRQWSGLQRGLHIDSWQRIARVEGWRLELRREPDTGPMRLWFVNVGAYDPACAWELHAFGLFVAGSAAAAKAMARRRLLVGAAQQHKDDSHALGALLSPAARDPLQAGGGPDAATAQPDDAVALKRVGRWHLHLLAPQPGADTAWQPLRPDWFGYRRIDLPAAG